MNYILDNYSIDEMFEEIDYENVCQITEKPLNKFHIKLKCGHKFNYESIFNEVKKQKMFDSLPSHGSMQSVRLRFRPLAAAAGGTAAGAVIPGGANGGGHRWRRAGK